MAPHSWRRIEVQAISAHTLAKLGGMPSLSSILNLVPVLFPVK